jgi:hypothetical protein
VLGSGYCATHDALSPVERDLVHARVLAELAEPSATPCQSRPNVVATSASLPSASASVHQCGACEPPPRSGGPAARRGRSTGDVVRHDQRHALGERSGAEAGAGTDPHLAPVVDAVRLLELAGRDPLGHHRNLATATVTHVVRVP